MANNVTSTVHVKGTKELIDEVEKMFNHKKGGEKYEMKTEWLAKTIYEEYDWGTTPIGAKWCYLEDDYRESDNEYYFTTVSAWSPPIQYLENLTEVLVKIDDTVIVECTYIDEAPNFVGGFYGSKNGTEDYNTEDYDEYPDEDDYLNEDDEVDNEAYDEALQRYYDSTEEAAQHCLKEAREEIEGVITESEK